MNKNRMLVIEQSADTFLFYIKEYRPGFETDSQFENFMITAMQAKSNRQIRPMANGIDSFQVYIFDLL